MSQPYKLTIRHITQSDEQLLKLAGDLSCIKGIVSRKRRRERLATSAILRHDYHIDPSLLTRDSDGRPHLSGPSYISISHSKDYVAVVVSHRPIATDIEVRSERPWKIRHRVLSNDEQQFVQTPDKALIAWSVKETVYKLIGKSVYNYREAIRIHQMSDAHRGNLQVTAGGKEITVSYHLTAEYVITVAML